MLKGCRKQILHFSTPFVWLLYFLLLFILFIHLIALYTLYTFSYIFILLSLKRQHPTALSRKKTAAAFAGRCCLVAYQSDSIAPTGQAPAQEPQLMHLSGSISNFPSPCEIAPTGHCPAHEPQLMQESLIVNAISEPSLIYLVKDDKPLDHR